LIADRLQDIRETRHDISIRKPENVPADGLDFLLTEVVIQDRVIGRMDPTIQFEQSAVRVRDAFETQRDAS